MEIDFPRGNEQELTPMEKRDIGDQVKQELLIY